MATESLNSKSIIAVRGIILEAAEQFETDNGLERLKKDFPDYTSLEAIAGGQLFTIVKVPPLPSQGESYLSQVKYFEIIAQQLGVLKPEWTWIDFYKANKERFMEIPKDQSENLEYLTRKKEENPGFILGSKKYAENRDYYNGDFVNFYWLETNIPKAIASVWFLDRWNRHPGNYQRGFINKYKSKELVPIDFYVYIPE